MLSHDVFSLAVAWAVLARGTHLLPHLRMLTLLMMVVPSIDLPSFAKTICVR